MFHKIGFPPYRVFSTVNIPAQFYFLSAPSYRCAESRACSGDDQKELSQKSPCVTGPGQLSPENMWIDGGSFIASVAGREKKLFGT